MVHYCQLYNVLSRRLGDARGKEVLVVKHYTLVQLRQHIILQDGDFIT